MTRIFGTIGGLAGFLGVALGAFGSHALRTTLEAAGRMGTYETAVQYQLIHALALLATAWAAERWPGKLTRTAGWAFAVGIVLFSGSLYVLAIFDLRYMGAIAPLGGAALLVGWACLGLAARRSA